MSPATRLVGTIEGVHSRSATDTAWLVVDTSIGLAVEAGRAGWWIGGTLARSLRPLRDLAVRPPLVPERYQPARLLGGLAAEGHDRRDTAIRAGRYLAQRFVPVVAAEVLDQLDLTELIRERVDLIGLARHVAAGLHLSGSIRESTGSLVSETLAPGTLDPGTLDPPAVPPESARQPRPHGLEADEAIAEWVDRIFRTRRPAADTDPDELTEPE